MVRSVSRSRSPSSSPRRKDHREPSRSRTRSLSPVRSRGRSRSISRSPVVRRSRRSPSRSRSRSPVRHRGSPPRYRGGGRRGGYGGRSRENPDPSRCVGVFNLSIYTTEKDLRDVFGKFGELEKVELVYDHPTGRSRGFGFIYFDSIDDSTAAREELNGSELDGHKIRVDYSLTKRAHTPTPGQYMGSGGGRGRGRGFGGEYRGKRDSYRDGFSRDSYRRRSPSPRRSYRRSPSPRYDRRRSRSRS